MCDWLRYEYDEYRNEFTGKERDSESGLDMFGAKYDALSMGHFMTPDWSAKIEPVPYSKLDNPQSLNLYSYVLNNPLSNVDTDAMLALVYLEILAVDSAREQPNTASSMRF